MQRGEKILLLSLLYSLSVKADLHLCGQNRKLYRYFCREHFFHDFNLDIEEKVLINFSLLKSLIVFKIYLYKIHFQNFIIFCIYRRTFHAKQFSPHLLLLRGTRFPREATPTLPPPLRTISTRCPSCLEVHDFLARRLPSLSAQGRTIAIRSNSHLISLSPVQRLLHEATLTLSSLPSTYTIFTRNNSSIFPPAQGRTTFTQSDSHSTSPLPRNI